MLIQFIDDEGNTFLHFTGLNKNYGYLNYINLAKLSILDSVNNNNDTLLSMAISDQQIDLVKYIIEMKWKSTRFLTTPYPYANILALFLHCNEDMAIYFMRKQKEMMRYVIDDYYKLTIDDDYVYSLVSLVCYLEKKQFLQEFIKNGYMTQTDIHNNFVYICKLLEPSIIIKLLKVDIIDPYPIVNQLDENCNNILQMAIIEKLSLVSELAKNNLINNDTFINKNKNGNNSFILACKHNFALAKGMYENLSDISSFIFERNNVNHDFIDII